MAGKLVGSLAVTPAASQVDWGLERQFWLLNRGRHLAAVLHAPQCKARWCDACGRKLRFDNRFCDGCGLRLESSPEFPIVLMLHGFTGHKGEARRLFVRMARKLAASGIAALRFDFAHSGDSEGSFEQTTVPGWLDDALAVYGFAEKLPWIDRKRIGLFGLSMGGGVVALMIPHVKARCVVQWAPVADFAGLADRVFHVPLSGLGYVGGTVDDGEGNSVRGKFFHRMRGLRPLDSAKGFSRAVLVLHGANDTSVPPSDGQAYLDAYGGQKDGHREIHLIKCPGHTFESAAGTNEVIGRTEYWFRKHLGRRRTPRRTRTE